MKNNGERVYQTLINVILIILSLASILPFVLLIITSFTDENTLIANGYSYFPKKFSLEAYVYLKYQAKTIFSAYGITLLVTAVGTTLSLLIQPMLAYPLSRKDFSKRYIFSFLVFFTMLFNGGLVPQYLMWIQVFHIKNTLWAYIFPNLMANAFGILLMKNYFTTNIPASLIEAAQIDGANEYRTFFQIILPLSLPIMATIGLMVGVTYWNDWLNGLYYITNQKVFSLPVFLNQIQANIQYLATHSDASSTATFPGTSVRMAVAVIGVVPIMVLYPFFQKYFVKGITIGAVKG